MSSADDGIDIIELAAAFEKCNIRYNISNVEFSYFMVDDEKYFTENSPSCDVRLAFNTCKADYIANKLIELGEALKKERGRYDDSRADIQK